MDTAQERWDAVDDWIESQLVSEDSTLRGAVAASVEAGLPPIQVSPAQGRMLELLVRVTNARTVLEVGTLGGYSTIWLARRLPSDGRVVTFELDPRHAEVARALRVVPPRVDHCGGQCGPGRSSRGRPGRRRQPCRHSPVCRAGPAGTAGAGHRDTDCGAQGLRRVRPGLSRALSSTGPAHQDSERPTVYLARPTQWEFVHHM